MILWQIKRNFFQDIIVVQMYEIIKFKCIFSQITWYFILDFFIFVYVLEKSLRMKFNIFHWDKVWKK
jgi:hypothetical protein